MWFHHPTLAPMDLRGARNGCYAHVLKACRCNRSITQRGRGLDGRSAAAPRNPSCPTSKEVDDQLIFAGRKGTMAMGSRHICPFLAGSPNCRGANTQNNANPAEMIPPPATQRSRELGGDLLLGGRT